MRGGRGLEAAFEQGIEAWMAPEPKEHFLCAPVDFVGEFSSLYKKQVAGAHAEPCTFYFHKYKGTIRLQ